MRSSEAVDEARRMMVICNACRYCEGYCAVFPAMERRRAFTAGDVSYLANLCHDCRGCYYACQYAPPHEFAVNLPQTLSRVRAQSYGEYAWPKPLAGLFERNGMIVSLAASAGIALVLLLATRLQSPEILYGPHRGPGSFYAVIPEALMLSIGLATFGFAVLALAMGWRNFWRDTGGGPATQTRPLFRAAFDVLTLRNLGGSGHGCNNRDESFSQFRRYTHQALFYGFFLCFASTASAAFYEHILGIIPPFPVFSLPVVLGTIGGLGMLIGAAGLAWIKTRSDPAPAAKEYLGADYALLALLFLSAATGLLLLALRQTPAMGVLLALHLGVILSFFLVIPYSKFVHGLYRSAALLRNATERKTP
ncbi:MAG TPA: tricarballylate utilization 4Fe-4S protein TcuB [Candidatus Dormibacteraeota bacterium]|nr:tricarballylate utilization 4Fe-4S protein TcuB [Candidatus Dormibacteraeota bacterium]